MMFKAVLKFLKATQQVWKQVTDMATDVAELETLVDEIDTVNRYVSGKTKGKTDQKEVEQEKMISMAHGLASTIAAMASRTGNGELLAEVDYPVSYLTKQRDEAQVTSTMLVVTLAREHLAELNSSNITEADVTALEEQITRFKECLPNKRVSVSEKKAANQKMAKLFKKTSTLLTKRLDKMTVRFETTNPDFYNAYLNARIIVDYGTRYEKEKGGEPGEPEA